MRTNGAYVQRIHREVYPVASSHFICDAVRRQRARSGINQGTKARWERKETRREVSTKRQEYQGEKARWESQERRWQARTKARNQSRYESKREERIATKEYKPQYRQMGVSVSAGLISWVAIQISKLFSKTLVVICVYSSKPAGRQSNAHEYE